LLQAHRRKRRRRWRTSLLIQSRTFRKAWSLRIGLALLVVESSSVPIRHERMNSMLSLLLSRPPPAARFV
jgi:hypothetical protein